MSDHKQKNTENEELFELKEDSDELEFLDAEIQQILDVLNEIPPVPVPGKFDLQFRRALKAEASKKKQKRLYRRLSTVAALMIIGVLSYSFMTDGFNLIPNVGNSDMTLDREGAGVSKEKSLLISDFEDIEEVDIQLFLADLPADDENEDTYGVMVAGNEEELTANPWSSYKSNDQIQYSEAPQPRNIDFAYDDEIAFDAGEASGGEMPGKEADPFAYRDGENVYTDDLDGAIMEGAEPAAGSAGGASGSGVNPSRSFSYYSNFEEFRFLCDSSMERFTAAISDNNALALEQLLNGEEKQSASAKALSTMKLYQDLFAGGSLSYQGIKSQYSPALAVYELSGNGYKLTIQLDSGTERLKIREPIIMDHALWLENQLNGERYTLESFEHKKDTGEITFNVRILKKETGESTEEIRSIVWKKTES